MKIKEWLKKFKREETSAKEEKKEEGSKYPNRFLKFYYQNQERLNTERRGSYSERKKSGVCVRCKRNSLPGIVFCEYHQGKQKEYNLKARKK